MINMEEVNRLYSIDALIFIPIVIIIFHLLLVKNKEFKTMIVFHIAGGLNFLLEIFLITGGTRIIETNNVFLAFLVLFDVSWVTMGLFCSLAYININKVFENSDIDIKNLLLLNLIFFIGIPLASINWGIFRKTILTRRLVTSPTIQPILQLSCVILLSMILFFTGYKKLTSLLLLGVIFGSAF